MKLSELINWKNKFDQVDLEAARRAVDKINYELSVLEQNEFPLDLENLKAQVQNIDPDLYPDRVEQEYQQEFDRLERQYLQLSYQNFAGTKVKSDSTVREERYSTSPPAEVVQLALGVTSQHIAWNYPALELFPGDGFWTRSLVAGDPLYLVDSRQAFLDETCSQFNDKYQKKIRPYLVDKEIITLRDLPQGQIGYAFSYGAFEFLPYEVIRRLMRELFDVMHPGGHALLSYNNAEKVASCQLVEANFRCYFTREYMQMMAEGTGFNVVQYFEPTVNTSLVLLEKPGELKSPRLQQTRMKLIKS